MPVPFGSVGQGLALADGDVDDFGRALPSNMRRRPRLGRRRPSIGALDFVKSKLQQFESRSPQHRTALRVVAVLICVVVLVCSALGIVAGVYGSYCDGQAAHQDQSYRIPIADLGRLDLLNESPSGKIHIHMASTGAGAATSADNDNVVLTAEHYGVRVAERQGLSNMSCCSTFDFNASAAWSGTAAALLDLHSLPVADTDAHADTDADVTLDNALAEALSDARTMPLSARDGAAAIRTAGAHAPWSGGVRSHATVRTTLGEPRRVLGYDASCKRVSLHTALPAGQTLAMLRAKASGQTDVDVGSGGAEDNIVVAAAQLSARGGVVSVRGLHASQTAAGGAGAGVISIVTTAASGGDASSGVDGGGSAGLLVQSEAGATSLKNDVDGSHSVGAASGLGSNSPGSVLLRDVRFSALAVRTAGGAVHVDGAQIEADGMAVVRTAGVGPVRLSGVAAASAGAAGLISVSTVGGSVLIEVDGRRFHGLYNLQTKHGLAYVNPGVGMVYAADAPQWCSAHKGWAGLPPRRLGVPSHHSHCLQGRIGFAHGQQRIVVFSESGDIVLNVV